MRELTRDDEIAHAGGGIFRWLRRFATLLRDMMKQNRFQVLTIVSLFNFSQTCSTLDPSVIFLCCFIFFFLYWMISLSVSVRSAEEFSCCLILFQIHFCIWKKKKKKFHFCQEEHETRTVLSRDRQACLFAQT